MSGVSAHGVPCTARTCNFDLIERSVLTAQLIGLIVAWGAAMTKQILLIEDEENIAEAIRFILSRDGWTVEVLADGAAAAAALARIRPDMLILDLMLPGKTGLEILTDLRADPEFVALPVLMLTAKGQGRDREAAERAGVLAFMTKPFDNGEIRAAVRDLMGA